MKTNDLLEYWWVPIAGFFFVITFGVFIVELAKIFWECVRNWRTLPQEIVREWESISAEEWRGIVITVLIFLAMVIFSSP